MLACEAILKPFLKHDITWESCFPKIFLNWQWDLLAFNIPILYKNRVIKKAKRHSLKT